ncbi:hypothetical protein PCCS19_43280 [Paenibacillus sp. CCS19]|uniref:hypothetical protein n=1 Tax=Paenibacillus sp. CCS19 TaxID=3158387 RepID=UPI002568489A|nr:hypothetical protein [Paenibacillus cellulosilyticus]GMK41272.1 hypothetical protein PCCS19_43280 [Paenibacillus cellulosilyticus]
MKVQDQEVPTINEFMQAFFQDFKDALVKWDLVIRDNFMSSDHKDTFYSNYGKGLDTWSITEPIIKFLAYTELCKVYKIRPEDHAYNDGRMLDYSVYIQSDDHDTISEIGIELKWGAFTRKGLQKSSSIRSLINDFVKMKELQNDHKYFIQHSISSLELELQIEALNNQITDEVDGRLIRKWIPRLIDIKSFEIVGAMNEAKRFNLLLWSVEKR